MRHHANWGRSIQSWMIASTLVFVLWQGTKTVSAGPLTPPGPPAPTSKTLNEIEPRTPINSLPFVIEEPGSYYLTRNLIGSPGQN